MKERLIKKEDFITTKWAGGETTQLAIYPEDATFSDKDFLWRVSSATFTSTESQFSDFSNYQRYILPLEGKLHIAHKGLYERKLDKYEVEYFDGSWTTFSENTRDCRDYNFIVKSGSLAKMQILNQDDRYILKPSIILTIFSMEDCLIEMNGKGDRRELEGFSLCILETDSQEEIRIIRAKLPVIITEFQIK